MAMLNYKHPMRNTWRMKEVQHSSEIYWLLLVAFYFLADKTLNTQATHARDEQKSIWNWIFLYCHLQNRVLEAAGYYSLI